MLNKVIKYDLKYVYKVLIVFYILSLLFALFTRIFWGFDNSKVLNVLGYIASGTTIAFIFNILINNIIRLWSRFVLNVYKDESYLTHTLPVSKKTIYLSKFLSSIITVFTSVVVILISLFIAYYSKENMQILKDSLTFIAFTYDSSVIKLLLVVFIVFFLEILFLVQAGYLGIIVGHRANNGKMVKSIIYGFIFYIISQMILLLIMLVFGLFNPNIMNLFITNENPEIDVFKKIMYFGIVIYTILLIIYYVICVKLFEKGVNVE